MWVALGHRVRRSACVAAEVDVARGCRVMIIMHIMHHEVLYFLAFRFVYITSIFRLLSNVRLE